MAPNVGLGTEGPVQRGWSLWLASVLGVVIAGLFVAGRLLQRWMKLGHLGLDDYMIVAALISSALLSVTECQAVVYGYGRKYASLPHDKRMIARKWFYGAQIMYKIVPTLTKVSIVCLYYRLFSVATNSFRTICHIANAFIISAGLAFTIGTVFQCRPIAAFWDRSIQGKCFKNEPWWISFSVIQILTDVALLIIPIRQIFTLSMTRTEKIGLSLVFCTGFFVTFASIYRATTLASSAKDPDPTWGPIPATIWSVIEVNAGIICACLPMLRHPFLKIFGPLLGSNRTKTNKQSYHLTSRDKSLQQRSKLASKNDGMQLTEFDRESEENIISPINNEAYGTHEPKHTDLERSKSAIYVKSEFTVRTSDNETRKVTRSKTPADDKSGTGSVNDEKPDGKDTFFHI